MEQRHWNQITRINIAINRQVAVVFDSSNDLNARDILFISSISWFGVLVMQGTFANCQHVSSWEKFSASNIFSWNVNISFNNLGYIFHLWKSDNMYVFGWFLTVSTCIPSIFLLVLAGMVFWTPALSIDNFFPNFWKKIYISENIPYSFRSSAWRGICTGIRGCRIVPSCHPGWGAVSDLGGSYAERGFKIGHRHWGTTTRAIKTAPFNWASIS